MYGIHVCALLAVWDLLQQEWALQAIGNGIRNALSAAW
jgi:hypothetical protein